jgi:hypothetical protein
MCWVWVTASLVGYASVPSEIYAQGRVDVVRAEINEGGCFEEDFVRFPLHRREGLCVMEALLSTA